MVAGKVDGDRGRYGDSDPRLMMSDGLPLLGSELLCTAHSVAVWTTLSVLCGARLTCSRIVGPLADILDARCRDTDQPTAG